MEDKLLKKILDKKPATAGVIKTWARRSQISPEMVGFSFGVHNGKTHVEITVPEEMLGHRLRGFSRATKAVRHGGKMQKELESKRHQAEIASAKAAKASPAKAPAKKKSYMANATLKSHNQSPRKVRLVTDLVKGKKVPAALIALEFLPRRASEPVAKVIKSAAANAKSQGQNPDELTVKSIIVESAGMMKKYMPRAFGRAAPIRRKKSRVIVTLSEPLS